MKLNYFKKARIYLTFFILFTLLFINKVNSQQCAGTDATVTICDKELNPTLQSYNLFNQLGGNPVTGGIWSVNHPFNRTALVNSETGILNLWLITRNGTHTFTYTNDTCNESATITIHLGGYAGEDNILGGANACSDDNAVNLNSFLSDELNDALNADTNGIWRGDPNARPHLSNDGTFNAEEAGIGTYEFTYTVNQVASCSSKTSNVVLEVRRASQPGTPINLILCESDDLSQYTNFDLFDLLIDNPDTDGIWIDVNGTSQIDDFFDHTINIQEIFNNSTLDSFQYTYQVIKEHVVCDDKFATVTISMVPLSGQLTVNDYCNDGTLDINLSYRNNDLVEFSHNLAYEIRNANTNQPVYTSNTIAIEAELIQPIDPAIPDFIQYNYDRNAFLLNPSPITAPGSYTVTVTSITDIDGITCASLNILGDTFTVYQPEVSLEDMDTCVKVDDIANISITNHVGLDGNLSNNTESLEYNITYESNTILINNDISFIDGKGIIPINLALFNFPENPVSGDINLTFNNAEDTSFECIDETFTFNFPPSKIELSTIIDNECDATKVEVKAIAPPLTDGEYLITYNLTRVGSTTNLLTGVSTITGGELVDDLNISDLEKGNYQVTIRSTQNDTTPCRTEFDFELIENFSIAGTPDAPVVDANQSFCFEAHPPNGPTIADIPVTSNHNLIWYKTAALNDTTVLNTDTLLENGNYYVSANDPDNNCGDSPRVLVTITIQSPTTPTTNNPTPTFCFIDNATLATIDVTAENGGTIIWYDSNGVELPINTSLINGTSYFATERIGTCESESLEFPVNIINPPTPINSGQNTICVPETSTIEYLETLISTSNPYTLVWFDATNTKIPSTTLLVQNEIYTVKSTFEDSDCFSPPLNITVNITVSPTIADANVLFCSSDNATIADLEVISTTGSSLIWYNNAIGGNSLPEETVLTNDTTYYVAETNGACESITRLQLNITIISPPLPLFEGDADICPLDDLTILALEENINLTGLENIYEVIWYDANEDGFELSTAEPLEANTSYYAVLRDIDTGCEGDRLEIPVKLINCDPDKYHFFIPDGFSPNNDGTNDTYFIPNIEFFYPNYDYEIFNRYGQSLFKGDINNPSWDGTNNGSVTETTSGVYFYILNYNNNNNDLKPEQGRIYLSK